MHSGNPEIIELAGLIGRTPSSVAMKLVNFASLDPSITQTGRKGLSKASTLDKEVWSNFHSDWESLAEECEALKQKFAEENSLNVMERLPEYSLEEFVGETTRAVVEIRLKQRFFRNAVLSSYRERCCMSGVSDTRLLVASHIVPWKDDKSNRLNPRNGLCLSAIHDKAFDKGLLTITDDLKIVLSEELLRKNDSFIQRVFHPLHNRKIEEPERFIPDRQFLEHHRQRVFLK